MTRELGRKRLENDPDLRGGVTSPLVVVSRSLPAWVITSEGPSCDGQRDHANGSRGTTQHTMALDQCGLFERLDALKAADVDDRIRWAATTIYQALFEAELTAVIGAAPHERTGARTAQRNGSRPRTLTTTAGDLELLIPKLRAGSFMGTTPAVDFSEGTTADVPG